MGSIFSPAVGWAVLGAAVLGTLFESGAGMVVGATVGALWGTVSTLTSRVRALEGQIQQAHLRAEWIENQVRQRLEEISRRAAAAAPATTATAPPAPTGPTPHIPPSSTAGPVTPSAPEVPAPPAAPAPLAPPPVVPPALTPAEGRSAGPTGLGVESSGPATPDGGGHVPGTADRPVAPPPFVAPTPVAESAPHPLVAAIIAFFTTGNLVAKVGVLILFVGVAFLVRFAADRGLLPIEYRLMGVTVAAIAALVLGWRLRRTQPDYAIVVQGGAVGVLYLTIFAAFRLYDLLPAGAALGLMLVVVGSSGALAVLQDRMTLAVLGTAGGFLAPLLASTGQGSHVALFSYYLALNAGVLGLAWMRTWRLLNWLGFLFTFGIGFLWGGEFYEPALFSTTEPFLVTFFLLYVAVSVLFAHRQPPNLRGHIDGSLVFGLPAVAFAMQSHLVGDVELGRAFSALAVSAFYLTLSRALWRRTAHAALAEAFLALAVVFLTLTIPLAFDGHAVAAGWALEGAALVWVGFRQRRLLARTAGALLAVAAGIGFFALSNDSHSTWPVLNTRFLGGVAVAAGALLAAWQYFVHRASSRRWEPPIEAVLLTWGLLWWAGIGLHELVRFVDDALIASASLGLSLSAVAAGAASRRLTWPGLGRAGMALVPGTVLLVATAFVVALFKGTDAGPWLDLGWAAWPVFIAASGIVLHWFEGDWPAAIVKAAHAVTAWTLIFLATWAAGAAMALAVPEGSIWASAMWAVVPAAAAFVLATQADRLPWPVAAWPAFFGTIVAGAPLAAAVVWCVFALGSDGNPAPLAYAPVLNPLELTQAFVLFAVALWARRADGRHPLLEAAAAQASWAVMGLGFACVNAAVARTVHFYGGVPYDADAMWTSPLFQASTSVLWAVTSLGLMAVASRLARRTTWMVGAALLGALVVKLFTVDLGGIGTVARIVSFLATGLLIMVIGYLSPVPPRRTDA